MIWKILILEHGPHYNDVITSAMASQITSLANVYPTFHSGADQRKHQNSASLAFVRGIHWWPVNSPHKGPVTRKMFPFDDVIMNRVRFASVTGALLGYVCKFTRQRLVKQEIQIERCAGNVNPVEHGSASTQWIGSIATTIPQVAQKGDKWCVSVR